MKDINILYRSPSIEEYISLRKAVGWNIPDEQVIKISLKNALFSVCLEKGNKIIGCGRVIGDEGLYLYIQDIIVLPAYQGHGYGKKVMDEIMNYINHKAGKGAFIGLFSAKGLEGFYKKYGFKERPDENSGAGMFLFKLN
ncbi:MAG: GNAT family N-acetyltransferase [bacterium]